MKITDLKNYNVVGYAAPATHQDGSTPQTPESSTLADKATFPATGNESPLGAAAKSIGNIPSSTFNFGKSVADFLNPLHTVKTAQSLGTSIAGGLNEGDNPAQLAVDTVKGLPSAAYKTLVPQFLQHVFSGDLGKAAAAVENDPIGQIAPLVMLARQGAQAAGKGAEFDNMVSTAAKPAPLSAATDAAKGAVGGTTRFLAGQLTGISPSTIERIVGDPYQFSKEAQSTVTRPALAESISKAIQDRQAALEDTGNEYGAIRTNTTPVQVAPNYLDALIKETTGLNVAGGKLHTSGSASVRLPTDVNALQTKLYNVWAPEFSKGYLTPEEFLNFRRDLSKLAYNDSGIGKNTDLAHLSEIIRGKVNSDLRPQIPGLEQLDKKFAPEQTALKHLTKGLVDNEGNLTDAAINRIANATGKGKDPLLARLETLSPGMTDKIKILKAVEDLQNSREVKTGTYLRAGALGAGIFTLNPYLIVSAIASIPEIAVPLLRGMGYSSESISRVSKILGLKTTPAAKAAKSAILKSTVGVPSVQNGQITQTGTQQ